MKVQKQQVRQQVRRQLNSLSEEEKDEQSTEIFEKLEKLPEFQCADIMLMYWSLPNEVATHNFIEKWSASKTILLPCVQDSELILKHYTEKSCLITGKYAVCEPATEQFSDYSKIDLCIIPGLAFDKHGNRLGKGKGFYDKFLPNINAVKIGVCFDIQLLDNVPCDDWDKKMDLVITPTS